MSRHSKNNTANPVFTQAERRMVRDFGNQVSRVGGDSQKPFEFCNLCVSKVIEPMACDHGHLFCKECIIENMVNQKKSNAKLIEAFERRQQVIRMQKEAKDHYTQKQKEKEFEKFDYQNDIITRKENKYKAEQKLQGYVTEEVVQKEKIKEQLLDKGMEMIVKPKEQLISKNFWIPETIIMDEEMKDKEIPPKNVLKCPATKDHDIKLKLIYKVCLFDGGNPQGVETYCYACNRALKYQKMSMSRHCGHVMCKSCIDKVCMPDKRCMVCNTRFEEAKSGFASHNSVEVKVYTPHMLI